MSAILNIMHASNPSNYAATVKKHGRDLKMRDLNEIGTSIGQTMCSWIMAEIIRLPSRNTYTRMTY